MIGTKLAHYRILKKIGEGGMGEVFVAEDERLKRHVALKVLNDDSAMDRTRSARFHRETKAVAAINHPNVVTLYSVEEFDGKRFLAMEWVEGEILSEVVPEGTLLSLSRFLDYAIPLVEGVKAAHDLGIAHRDLKPRNVMIDKEGRIKLLDFGLARWRERDDSGDSELTDVLTLTQTGAVLGTPAYMSPEQLRGKGVDHRTDLFSIGVMFFEMLAGVRPYRGETPTEMATSILRDDPPKLTVYRTDLPRRVQRLLDRCLEKKTEDRYQSADELLADLKELQRESQIAELSASVLASPGQRRFKWLAWASFVLVPVLVGALVWVWWWFGLGSQPLEPQATTLVSWVGEIMNAQLSPDGNWVSFLSNRHGPRQLYLQRVDGGGEPRVVEGARASALSHLWSPDGDDFAVLSRSRDRTFLLVVPALGGPPKLSVMLPRSYAAGDLVRWIDTRVYLENEEGLHRLDLIRDPPEPELVLSRESRDGLRYRFDVSPDEDWVVFLRRQGDQFFVWRSQVDGSGSRRLTEHTGIDSTPRFFGSQGRHVVFKSTLGGRPDIWALGLSRGRRPQRLSMTAADKSLHFATAAGLKLLVRERTHRSGLYLASPDGLEPLTDEAGAANAPNLVSNGRVAFVVTDPRLAHTLFPFGSQIHVAELRRSNLIRREVEVNKGAAPKFSPDGRFLTYWQQSGGDYRLVRRDLGTRQELLLSDSFAIPGYSPRFSAWSSKQLAWAPDSKSVYFVTRDPAGLARNVHRMGEKESGPAFLWNCQAGREIGDLHVSPSGGELAFLVSGDYRLALDATLVKLDLASRQLVEGKFSGDYLGIFGWADENRLFVGRSTSNADFTDEIEVLEIVDFGEPRVVGRLGRTKRGAVVLSDNELIFPAISADDGTYDLFAFALSTGETRRITSNDRAGARVTGAQRVAGDTFLFAIEEPWSTITLLSLESE